MTPPPLLKFNEFSYSPLADTSAVFRTEYNSKSGEKEVVG